MSVSEPTLPKRYPEFPESCRESEHHVRGNDLYVTDKLKVCPKCPDGNDIHPLRKFHKRANGEYSVLCRTCLDAEHRRFIEERDVKAVDVMSTVVTETLREKKKGNTNGNLLDQTLATFGGGVAADSISKVLRRAMDNGVRPDANTGQINLAVKAATTLLSIATESEKNKKSGDFSEWTDEEAADICMELIRENKVLRSRIISDPHIRRMLLNEAGVDVIDVATKDKD